MSGYLYARGWDDFQHYKKNTTPTWIKSYRKLLANPDYVGMSASDRGILHGIWLLIATYGQGQVTADSTWLARQLSVRRVNLDVFIEAGWLAVDYRKGLDHLYSKSSAEGEGEGEGEKETEKEIEILPPNPPQEGGTVMGKRANGTNPRALELLMVTDERHAARVKQCRRLYDAAIARGEDSESAREALQDTFKRDPEIITEALADKGAA